MNEILFHNINTDDKRKCGDIFVSKNGKFHIYCTLCDKDFFNCNNYILHVLESHLEINNIDIDGNIDSFLLTKEFTDEYIPVETKPEYVPVPEKIESDICEIDLSEFVLINKNSEEICTNKTDVDQSTDFFENNEDSQEPERKTECLIKKRRKTENNGKLTPRTENENSNSTENNEEDNISLENDKCKLQCQYCGKYFPYKSHLVRHENSHKKKNIKNTKETINVETRKLRKKNYKKQKHVCEHCGKETISYFNMKMHLRVHDQNRVTFNCHICAKKFFRKDTLESHIRLHLNDKKFACQYCGKCFVDEVRKKTHEKIHTHERTFQCNVCSKRFLYKSKLNEHTLIYHIKGRIFECDECDKRFYDEYTLNIHKPSHSSEKPFCCDQCPSKFPRKSGLLIHKKLHSDKKDYICKICGKDFAQYNGIYAHMKSHGIKYSLAYEKGLCEAEKIG